jgi:hypothetical protein
MSEKQNTIPSPAPVLVMFTLALMAIIQLFFPDLIHPGLTLAVIGAVFLALYFTRWVHHALTLILGWMLAGFGLSFWLASQPLWVAHALPLMLIGLGLGFVAIYITGTNDGMLDIHAKYWPLVPAMMLLIVAAVLILEGIVGRQRLWGVVVPLIPAVTAVWYMTEWRRAVATAQKA